MIETTASAINFDSAQDLPELYRLLDQVQMKNGWAKAKPSMYPEPQQDFKPAHWRYADARAALHAAGRLVGTEWAERRNLIMANPVENNDYATVKTLVAAYQMVKGGEFARSHRHTPNAMRIVLEAAPETYTIVDGKRIPMLPGDVLLTPNWCYHGHHNASGNDSYWVDVLDAPLVHFLHPMFFQVHPDTVESARQVEPASPYRFAHEEYWPRLQASPEQAPGVRTLVLGPPTMPTFDRVVVHLEAGATWELPKTTANYIYTVIRGAGVSTIGDRRFEWSAGDMIAVPSWSAQLHVAGRDTLLVRVSDEPVMRTFDWYRQEAVR